MVKRIITAAVALAVFIPVLYFSETVAFPIVFTLLSMIAVDEIFGCTGMRNCHIMYFSSMVFACAMSITARYIPELMLALTGLYICAIVIAEVAGFKKYDLSSTVFSAFQTIVAVLGLSLMVVVRDREPVRYLLIFVAAWMTDTCAYFSGMLFGKRKLCPDISPKKTVAGAVGGVVGCAVGFVVFGLICNTWFDCDFSLSLLAIIALPLSVIGQFGDLAASTVKRHFGVKDYGKLFPGHGGVLDRFDSILPITVLAYIFTEISGLV